MAREIEVRLEKSIQDERLVGSSGDKQNRAIARLVGTLAQYANGTAGGHWRSNRFAFECFSEAVRHTMEQLSYFVPKEPNSPPLELKESCAGNPELACWLDPKNIGRSISFGLFAEVRKQKPPFNSDFPNVFHVLPDIGDLLEIPKGQQTKFRIGDVEWISGSITDRERK